MTSTAPSARDSADAAARLPGFADVTQVAVISADAAATVRGLGSALGAGSFKVVSLGAPQLFNTYYGDTAENWSMKVGLTWIGAMQLEVIQPLGGRNLFADYLAERGGRAGVQHIFLQRAEYDYDAAIEAFERAGYPVLQRGQMNARGRLGFVPVPPLPSFLAARYASRFCYANSRSALHVDVELAKFPPGVSHRAALRAAIPDEWIPAADPSHFETLPLDAVVSDIEAVYVLGERLDALIDGYAKLTDRRPRVIAYANDVLPGEGRLAEIRLTSTAIRLVEPHTGPLRALRETNGSGVQLIGASTASDAPGDTLRRRGWSIEPHGAALFATHADVPFALWVARGR